MLKSDWRSFSETDLVQSLLTLFHLEEFEPTLLFGTYLGKAKRVFPKYELEKKF